MEKQITKVQKSTKKDPIIPPKEHVYLEGPKSRGYELLFAWRVFWEFIQAFRTLHFVGPCITVFGSARFKEDNQYYISARDFGREIAHLGFTTITGGGPGVMEAANRGAIENGGMSIGCNIRLPFEQAHNKYMHKWMTFEYKRICAFRDHVQVVGYSGNRFFLRLEKSIFFPVTKIPVHGG